MGRPFSERVADSDWRREVESWIHERLHIGGVTVTGPLDQVRIRPWSTQLTVATDAGTMWFKATCRAMAFEPALQAALARIAPDAVDRPIAADEQRGWMLTGDRGATLGESQQPTTDDWRDVLVEAARLQQAAVDHREALLATGMPDCAPETVVDRFDRLLEVLSELPDEHPAQIPPVLASQLAGRRSAIVDAAAELAGSSLPATWQHGDLHPWNVFDTGSHTLRLFDFGDAQWAHAAEVLSVPFGWITTRTSLPWEDIFDSYGEVWQIGRDDLQHQVAATALTQPVNRSLLWWSCLQEATADEWREWGDAPVHHLTRVLDA